MSNYNYNSINTGLAQKVDQFRWSGSLENKPHIVGTYKSAPDFSIPPTPASSYANIHVVLDTVHQSTLTRTTGTVLPTPLPQYNLGAQSRSFSELPARDNGLFSDLRAVPDTIDPEQPGARSDFALTSLKSEIAPITPGFTSLDEYDSLAERTDRELPASVDIGLVDETYERRYPSKEWALMEEEERSWRMSRPIDARWASLWEKVGAELEFGSGLSRSWGQMEENERLWRMSRPLDSTWSGKWRRVGQELLSGRSSGFSRNWEQLEDQERSWRMSRPIDATWSGKWRKVGEEVKKLNFNFDDLTAWVDRLKRDIETQSSALMKHTNASLDKLMDSAVYAPSTLSWSKLNQLEETERRFRMALGADPVLSGKWHLVGRELNSLMGSSWSEWLLSIKNKAYNEVRGDVRALRHVELPSISLPSLPSVSLPSINLPSINLPDLKLGVTKSEATTPMFNDNYPIDFTFKSSRTSLNQIQLEEEERSRRMSSGVNPIIYGLWYRLGLELKNRYSLRPTFQNAARGVVSEAEFLVEKAENLLGSFASSAEAAAEAAVEYAKESLTPAVHKDFAEHGKLPLNLYAFTAEKVDFTFKSRRTPQSIINLEEAERSERMKNGANRILLARFHKVLAGGLPRKVLSGADVETLGETFTHAKEVLLEKTSEVIEEAEKLAESAVPQGWTGFFGSLAHSVADKTSHFVEAAKETLHISEHASISSAKYEEAERSRRMSAKVDPLTAARLGRVQEELLSFTVKSV